MRRPGNSKTPPVLYEENAHEVTVVGWVCKTCKRFFGENERGARYCCATSLPCECGGRREKSWTHCSECRRRFEVERWEAREATAWDGTFPIVESDRDRYYFDEDALFDAVDEIWHERQPDDGEHHTSTYAGLAQILREEFWLVSCKPNKGRHFEMTEYLCDDLPEDGELDDEEINATVNEWIEKNGPFSWSPSGVKLDIESVIEKLGWDADE